MPVAITRTVDVGWFRWFVRLVGLATFLYAMVSLMFGVDRLTNPIFGFIYILVWVGLVPISLVFGPVWRTLNPLRTLHLLLSKLLRQPPSKGLLELPAWVGSVACRARHLRLHLAGTGRAGPRHPPGAAGVDRAVRRDHDVRRDPVRRPLVLDGRSVRGLRDLMSRLSPWGRRTDGSLVIRRPLENLDGLRPQPGLVGMVAALLGSTAYDGFSNSSSWIGWAQNQDISMTWLGTRALIVFILFVLITYSGATILAGRLSDSSRTALPGLFAHSVVPIAFGYVVAHYLTLFILEGQRTLIYLSDPLSNGANIFGTGLLAREHRHHQPQHGDLSHPGRGRGLRPPNRRRLRPRPRSSPLPPPKALAGQLPLLVVMVGYTCGGLLLLFSS